MFRTLAPALGELFILTLPALRFPPGVKALVKDGCNDEPIRTAFRYFAASSINSAASTGNSIAPICTKCPATPSDV